MKRHLIIGNGEIGKSLQAVLEADYAVDVRDRMFPDMKRKYHILHICYPFSDEFIRVTKAYQRIYDPELIIIHSTVRPGTTRKLGRKYVYSPVRGTHPNLALSIRTFVKYFGAEDPKKGKQAIDIFRKLGVNCFVSNNPTEIEVLKILSTTAFGWNILFNQEAKKICDKYRVNFDIAYTHESHTYNAGYDELDMGQFHKQVLKYMPGKIGGHCVLPNCQLIDSDITKYIIKKNHGRTIQK